MKARLGERLIFRGKKVGRRTTPRRSSRSGGDDGAPPYLVRFPDGHERLVFPGTDCQVLHGDHPETNTRSDVAAEAKDPLAA
jgi:hypothetical protein